VVLGLGAVWLPERGASEVETVPLLLTVATTIEVMGRMVTMVESAGLVDG